jgi:hypothetical protein
MFLIISENAIFVFQVDLVHISQAIQPANTAGAVC